VNPQRAAEVSVYDRLRHGDGELCALLAAGAARHELIAMLGAADHALLTALARRALATAPRHAETVYLLPGIMGTQLGVARVAPLPPDLLWLDPQDIIGGGLDRLRLDAPALITLGAIQYSYLALQLRLRAAGFRVVVHDYDWRADLGALATDFAARLRADDSPGVAVIAHSMGGLIARRALVEPGLERLLRLITLGTPHAGSYGAVQALRGTYPVVRRLAALDRQHDAEYLATRIFSTFPSIHQLLPAAAAPGSPSLLDAASWPATGPRPDAQGLAAARSFAADLPPADARCIAISGTHQRTVTGLRLADDDFLYEVSDGGDGTVPLNSAAWTGCDNYFVRCEHSALPRSATVARALLELLRHGRTARLASGPGRPRGLHVTVSDRDLRHTWCEKIDWLRLAPAARRAYLNRLNEPPAQYAARRAAARP